jgi:heme exporter protein C
MTTTAIRPTTPVRIHQPLAAASLLGALIASAMALLWAPPDANQGEVQRIMYVHVPSAWTAYLAFFVVFLSSIGWLWTRRHVFDAVAVASAEVGVLFTALALVSGSIWAKPTWGVWWTWEPRLITTAVMFVMYLGYLLLRSLSSDVEGRATRAAVIGVVAVVNIPVVHLSVTWMNALHQLPSVLRPAGPSMDGRMLATLIVSVVAFTIIYAWLTLTRTALERERQRRLLEAQAA